MGSKFQRISTNYRVRSDSLQDYLHFWYQLKILSSPNHFYTCQLIVWTLRIHGKVIFFLLWFTVRDGHRLKSAKRRNANSRGEEKIDKWKFCFSLLMNQGVSLPVTVVMTRIDCVASRKSYPPYSEVLLGFTVQPWLTNRLPYGCF